MAILVDTRPIPSDAIVAALRQLAPGEEVLTDPRSADPAKVEVLLAWRLADGVAGRMPKLALVCAPAAGVEKLLVAADLPPSIPVTRTVDPEQNTQIAQYVTLMALRHVRALPLYEQQQRDRLWTRHPIAPAHSITAGVLGLGESGRVSAAMLDASGFKLAGWSRSPKTIDGMQTFSGPDGLHRCLAVSQIVVCLLPLTAATRHVLNRQTLASLPRGAYLINVARGGHLNEADLLEAIAAGQLAGAALDVQDAEPLPADSPLWQQPRLTITPHIASNPRPGLVARQLLENLQRLRQGRPLLNQVDRTLGY